jgi:hypothetical protein
MYLKFVVVLFFQLFSINDCILLPNQQRLVELPVVNPPIIPVVLPGQRPSMNPNCFQT